METATEMSWLSRVNERTRRWLWGPSGRSVELSEASHDLRNEVTKLKGNLRRLSKAPDSVFEEVIKAMWDKKDGPTPH